MLPQERTKMETKNNKVIKEAWCNKKNEVKIKVAFPYH